MTRMGRPPKADRARVLDNVLTLRLTDEDRALLAALAEARAAERAKLTGEAEEVSASQVVRWLIRQEATERGLVPGRPGAKRGARR
jgi:hypothetical protein